jgi:putative SOS response-associated peptidase YedK
MLSPPTATAPPWAPRYNGSPGQQHWVIRPHPETGQNRLGRLWWGLGDLLVPYPAAPMTMCPISRRVNAVANDYPELLAVPAPGRERGFA